MLWIEQGDRLPSVAMAQHLINSHEYREEKIAVDGHFGGKTRAAVRALQTRLRIDPSGIVDPRTWKRINAGNRVPFVDFVDANDAVVQAYVARPLVAMGSRPIYPPFLSDGVRLLAEGVARRVKKQGKIGLLRIYSHGGPGQQNMSKGLGGRWLRPGETCKVGYTVKRRGRSACVYGWKNGEALERALFKDGALSQSTVRHLRGLSRCFLPTGSIELHGCQVAQGRRGKELLQWIALLAGVPVTAAIGTNKTDSARRLLRVEHPRRTAFPGWAESLRDWASGNPFTPAPPGLRPPHATRPAAPTAKSA